MLEPVHPVRAPTGEALIPSAPPPKRHPYDQWSPDARALDLVGDKWTLLIVRDLAGGPRRFVELQRVLPGISTEQLRSRLNRMVADGLGLSLGVGPAAAGRGDRRRRDPALRAGARRAVVPAGDGRAARREWARRGRARAARRRGPCALRGARGAGGR